MTVKIKFILVFVVEIGLIEDNICYKYYFKKERIGVKMIQLLETGVYLVNGLELIADSAEATTAIKAKTGRQVNREDAVKETIAYNILKEHNTSDNMDKLKIKFDKLTSHDITFVGIIQTARASGLTKFPVPIS